MNKLTDKIAGAALALLAGSTFLAGCSAPAVTPGSSLQAQNVAAQSDPDSRYLITAQALIDKIATITDPTVQEKIKKDFEPQIKPLNRYALQNLIKYSVKVLQANLKPGQDPRQTPVAVLIYPMLNRMLDIYGPMSDRMMDMVMIATTPDPAQQEKLFTSFSQQVPKLAKADMRMLLEMLAKNESGIFPPDASMTQRMVQRLQSALNH